jgi:hypothetical protein
MNADTRLVAVLLGLGLCGCDRPAPPPPAAPVTTAVSTPISSAPKTIAEPWFTRMEASSGLDFRHASGQSGRFWFPEIETGGVGLIDYDRDGRLDVFCVDGGSLEPGRPHPPKHRLYRNLGEWKFADVTVAAGLACPDGYGMGCAVGDYDGDGYSDLYVTQLGSNRLYRNQGNGTFADVTAKAGVAVNSWSTSAAFVDYDGDGHLDLLVANYVRWSPATEQECFSSGGRRDYCGPKSFSAPLPPSLFHNQGNGTFADVTEAAGLTRTYGNGLGVATGDFDHDGRIDLFVANDAMANQLWLNQGGGKFVDDALLRGCGFNAVGVPRAGMGVVAVDLLQRGWLDLFVTHLVGEGHGLFLNRNGQFTDFISPDGPMAGSLPYTGFGVAFADFDLDGELDVYVGNGRVRLEARARAESDPYAEPNSLLRGRGAGRFEAVNPPGGVLPEILGTSRGVAAGDLDGDGAPDLVVIERDGPVTLLRNRMGQGRHWVQFELRDRAGREVRNAVLRLEGGGKTQWRQHQPNEGYCSSQDPRTHFGLGNRVEPVRLQVRWPDGKAEEFPSLPVDQLHRIQAGKGQAGTGWFDW